ncbi:hypothetical protein ASD11_02140 [Aeromicrobium sp. Root495]|uniref:DUF4229 domain-containing protein n=1 Tax=Aeromicrobium sp. Root495 TaxID=1736550 RepID=UPI0006FC8D89|nr:DUF4229 domain-containing protein [Aeromicrobium sp. Root495]KQY58487.1 hypothetical protein ASD11_02140 [Aeromicrobium sp. Root495]RYJ05262.1 MAG: DUF4229 domain-containing protein [Actinomycetales bacterium]
MKAFWTYTLARFAVFAAVYAVTWTIGYFVFDLSALANLVVLLISLIVSSIISVFALAHLREQLAINVQQRAERMSARIEESRSAEDVD